MKIFCKNFILSSLSSLIVIGSLSMSSFADNILVSNDTNTNAEQEIFVVSNPPCNAVPPIWKRTDNSIAVWPGQQNISFNPHHSKTTNGLLCLWAFPMLSSFHPHTEVPINGTISVSLHYKIIIHNQKGKIIFTAYRNGRPWKIFPS